MRLCVCMVVWVVVGGLLLPLKALEVPPVQFTTYTTIKLPNARYALWDGVAVAIEAIEARGGTVSVGTVMDELYEMHRRNDVKLPFSPSWRGKRKRPTIPNSKKRDKLEFESQLAKYIANHVAQSNGGEVVAAPTQAVTGIGRLLFQRTLRTKWRTPARTFVRNTPARSGG